MRTPNKVPLLFGNSHIVRTQPTMTEPLIRHTCARRPPSQSAKTRLLQLILVQHSLEDQGT